MMKRTPRLVAVSLLSSLGMLTGLGSASAQWSANPIQSQPQQYGTLQPAYPQMNYSHRGGPYGAPPYGPPTDPYFDRYGYSGYANPYHAGASQYHYRPDYPPYRHATPRQLEDYDNRVEQYRHGGGPVGHLASQERPVVNKDRPPVNDNRLARVQIILPNAAAQLWIDGDKSVQTGTTRTFRSPTLNPNKTYFYSVMAAWPKNGRLITEEREVEVHAGELSVVDFTIPAGPEAPSTPPAPEIDASRSFGDLP